MKAEKDKNGNIKEYEIGNSICIHRHISDPENWKVTIRPLNIFAETLCKINTDEKEIPKYVKAILIKNRIRIDGLIKDIDLLTD